jgi:SAM-dependent methyltransferase
LKKSLRMWRTRIEVARSDPAHRWRGGLEHELEFWDRWFATKGLDWPDDYRARLGSETSLQPELVALLQPIPDRELRLLDIGAGPLTTLGKRMEGRQLSIVATDALGDQYAKLFERYGVPAPAVRTIACAGEELADRFPPKHFHLVYAQNSLDHSIDPMRIIRGAVRLARSDGYVVLVHYLREAERETYNGLHQWNFELRDGKALLWRPGTRYELAGELAEAASVTASLPVEGRVRIVIRPKPGI